jgi:hypothetical protein
LKFKLDENLPDLVRQSLTTLGFDAHTVAAEQLAGAPDTRFWRLALQKVEF